MSRDELTREQRDAMTEDELVEADLSHLAPDDRSQARPGVLARVRRERQVVADAALAAEIGSSVRAVRQSRAEEAQRAAEQAAAEDLNRARRAVRPRKGGRRPTHDGAALLAAWRRYREEVKRDPSEAELGANLDPPISERTVRDVLRREGLPWPLE